MAASTYIPFGGLRCTVWMMFGRSEENPIFHVPNHLSFWMHVTVFRFQSVGNLKAHILIHVVTATFGCVNFGLSTCAFHGSSAIFHLCLFATMFSTAQRAPLPQEVENIDGTKCPKIGFVPGRYLDKRQPFRLGIIFPTSRLL